MKREKVERARAMYVFGVVDPDGKKVFPSLKRVSAMSGVPFTVLSRIAAKENWKLAREQAVADYHRRLREEAMSKHVQAVLEVQEDVLESVRLAVRLVKARLAQIAIAQSKQKGEVLDPKEAAVRSWEIRDLASSIETLKRIGSDVVGDVSPGNLTWADIVRIASGEELVG